MRKRMRKAGLGVLVGAVIVLGGGFASAGYSNGDGSPTTTVDVTYTVQTFRALELSSTSPVAFGTVRQGEVKTIDGPTVLYATTWSDDTISAYLNSTLKNGVLLSINPGTPTPPEDFSVRCGPDTETPVEAPEGTIVSPSVDVSDAELGMEAPIVEAINNCGAPTYGTQVSAPYDNPNRAALTWATFSTTFTLDTSAAEQTDAESLYADITKIVTFLIEG